ncbi:MAG TPA: GNAT family N-acetyltransferase [Methylomirabilota bacterium]|nr:GNAT family N-acetyltransferase [Methylomirabilota bacterium]
MAVTIAPESPRQADVLRLVEELDTYLTALYPPESNHLLDIETLAQPDIRFLVARLDGEVMGCVALRVDPAGWGEVKRLYVPPRARGLGIGRRLLWELEAHARFERLTLLRLETGIHQPEALGLFHAVGFRDIAAFPPYAPDPLSVFMEKTL